MNIMIVNMMHAQTAKSIYMAKHFGTHFTSWLSSGSQSLIKTSKYTMSKRKCSQIVFSVTRNVRGMLADHFKDKDIGFRNKAGYMQLYGTSSFLCLLPDRAFNGCRGSRHIATTSVTESCLVEQ
ncbi:hypothetical protein K501DRAFT_279670 [Backusella circina FSU 941]|nr:hypothetical protein K501DRAFT_279670 [Backusella circina FSU 941]